MKIILSAGNRIGAYPQLLRIKNKLLHNHIVKIAAYSDENYVNFSLQNISLRDKKLLELRKILKHNPLPRIDYNKAKILIDKVKDFDPDLIICDFEPIFSNIAFTLKIPLWYCSPIHLFDGAIQPPSPVRINLLDLTRKQLSALPKAERIFIYSPFGDLDNVPKLKPGYDWISPYSEKYIFNDKLSIFDVSRKEKLKNIFKFYDFKGKIVLDGNTLSLTDALYSFDGEIFLTPDYNNPEQVLNSLFCHDAKIAINLGQIEKSNNPNFDDLEFGIKNNPIEPKHPFLEEFLF